MGTDVSLYKISDVLQMPIHYNGKVVTGERWVEWGSKVGLKIPMQLSARAIFFSEQVGVVAHVIGNLYVMVAHNPEKHGLSAYMIDGARLTDEIEEMISKKMSLREVVEYLGKAVVKAFYNTSGTWKPLSLPK